MATAPHPARHAAAAALLMLLLIGGQRAAAAVTPGANLKANIVQWRQKVQVRLRHPASVADPAHTTFA